MKKNEIEKYANNLIESWETYRSENDWGSGGDSLRNSMDDIEKEYFLEL